jgi:hypothetical protein
MTSSFVGSSSVMSAFEVACPPMARWCPLSREIQHVPLQGLPLQNLADFAGPRNGSHGPADVSVGSWSCENSSALRKRRNISVKLGIMKPNHPAQIRLNTVLENCIFYISTMYEFSHRVGQNAKNSH